MTALNPAFLTHRRQQKYLEYKNMYKKSTCNNVNSPGDQSIPFKFRRNPHQIITIYREFANDEAAASTSDQMIRTNK